MWGIRESQILGTQIITTLKHRAFRLGLGLDDRPHTPYSKRYARRKAKSGRQVAFVDLTWTGDLLRSFRVKAATASRIVVGMSGAAALYGTRVNKQKPFIGLSKGDIARLRPLIKRLIDKKVRSAAKAGGFT